MNEQNWKEVLCVDYDLQEAEWIIEVYISIKNGVSHAKWAVYYVSTVTLW